MVEYIGKSFVLYVIQHFGSMQTWSIKDIISECKRKIESEKAADVAPMVHARWYHENNVFDDSTWVCSSCFEPWILISGTPSENNMNYCPNCGTKMDLEESK